MREEKYESKKRTFPPFSFEGKHRKFLLLPYPKDETGDLVERPVRGRVGGEGALIIIFWWVERGLERGARLRKTEKRRRVEINPPFSPRKRPSLPLFLTVETSNGLLAAGRKAAERRSESRECEEETDVEHEEEQAVAADDDSEFGIDSDSAAVAPVTDRRPRGAPGAQRGDRDAGKLLVTRDICDDAERFASFRNGISRKLERNRGRRR